jgi:hypothetical protein
MRLTYSLPVVVLAPLMATVFAAHAQGPTVVASCDFEGPYSTGPQQIQEGCSNNWQWGRKDMLFTADRNSGRPGTTQRIQIRGMASGAMQLFYTKLKLRKDHYYRVTCWMRSDGLEGPLWLHVRQIGYPWTDYFLGKIVTIPEQWAQVAITGKVTQDANDDLGMCWEGAWLGTVWIDDLKIEESTQPFASGEPSQPAVAPNPGNLLPRSSFEGRRDCLWSVLFGGGARDGVWEGVESEWEDPQMFRAEGGKVGRYCMAVPSAQKSGQAAAYSLPLDLEVGKTYTVSAWLKADREGYPSSLGALYHGGSQNLRCLAATNPPLTTTWQRASFVCTPQAPPEASDAHTVRVVLEVAPYNVLPGTVYIDGLQVETGDKPTEYRPAYPLELYADIGQDGGNLLEWGQKVPLNLLVAAADATALRQARIEVTVTGYPKVAVWKRTLTLPVNQETKFALDIKRHGLFRVDLRPVDASLAAPQEMIFALAPPPRDVGERGMFGTHIALRPFLVDYLRRLGFTWTRLHDCSRLSKWDANEPEPGKLQWHDAVVDAIRARGLHILGLPDQEPAWARVTTEGANSINVEAYGKYCERVARHYAGRIDHWELWNEPYMAGFYKGGAEGFGEVLQAGYAGIKRGNPQAKVLGWCADITNPAWGAKIPEAARRCIDIFTFHDYAGGLGGGGTLPFAAELPEHRAQWPSHVKECWNTEGTNGYVCANSFYTFMPQPPLLLNAQATAFASRTWVEHAKLGVSKFFVYQMHNVDSIMYYGGYQSLLIGYDRTPTPAAIAAATTAYCMDGLKATPCPELAGMVQGLLTGDGRATWVVYDDAGVLGHRSLNLTRLPAGAEVVDVMGNDPRRDGKKRWDIGIQPLFVLTSKLPPERLANACQSALVGRP